MANAMYNKLKQGILTLGIASATSLYPLVASSEIITINNGGYNASDTQSTIFFNTGQDKEWTEEDTPPITSYADWLQAYFTKDSQPNGKLKEISVSASNNPGSKKQLQGILSINNHGERINQFTTEQVFEFSLNPGSLSEAELEKIRYNWSFDFRDLPEGENINNGDRAFFGDFMDWLEEDIGERYKTGTWNPNESTSYQIPTHVVPGNTMPGTLSERVKYGKFTLEREVIPEPSTGILTLFGALGLGLGKFSQRWKSYSQNRRNIE